MKFCGGEQNLVYIVKRKIMDWNGKKARIEYIQDDTIRALQSRMVQQELNHEQALVASIQQLLAEDDLDHALNGMLETIGNYYQGERAFILKGETRTGWVRETHIWAKDTFTVPPVAKDFDIRNYSIWRHIFHHKQAFIISDINKLEKISPKEYAYLKENGIYNICAICFDMSSHNLGCIGIYNMKANQQDTELLESVGYFIKSEMEKRISMERLEREKEKITSLFNTMQGSYLKMKYDEHWTLVDANETFYSNIGYTRTEFEQKYRNQMISLLQEDYLSMAAAKTKEDLHQSNRFCGEGYMNRKDGSRMDYLIQSEIVVESDGEEYIHSTLMDITEQKGLRDGCERISKEIGEFYNSIPGGVFRFHDNGELSMIFANEGFFRFIGYTREEFELIFENSITRITHPEDVTLVQNRVKEQLQQGTKIRIENRLLCKDGEIKWIFNHAELMEDKKGQRFFYCIFVDITKQKEKQEELAVSEAFLRKAVEHTDLYFWEYDIRTDVCKNSFKSIRDFGMPEYMQGYPECLIQSGFVHPDDIEPYRELHRQLKKGLSSAVLEARIMENGKPSWKRVHYTTIFDQENRPIKAFGTTEDIERDT